MKNGMLLFFLFILFVIVDMPVVTKDGMLLLFFYTLCFLCMFFVEV